MATHVEPLDSVALESVFPGDGEMAMLLRGIDWSKTAVGPVGSWPQSLRTSVQICLTSRHPMFIAWGPEWTYFYNDAYRPILGTKHPKFLGRSLKDCWIEIWEDIGPIAERVKATGRAEWFEDLLLVMSRNGYTEETHFTFSYSPLRDDENRIVGMFCACIETTDRVLQERRLRTLIDLTTESGTVAEAGRKAAEVLARNGLDIPFALLYLLSEDRKEARLFGRSGFFRAESGAAPDSLAIEGPHGPWPLRDVLGSGQAVRVDRLSERFDDLPRPHWPEADGNGDRPPLHAAGPEGAYRLRGPGRQSAPGLRRQIPRLLRSRGGPRRHHRRQRPRRRGRAQAGRGAGRARSREDRVLLEREPRVPDAAHAPARPARGRAARRAEGLDPRSGALDGPPQRLRLLKLVNTLLDFSRIEAGRVEATFEPTDLAT